MAAAKRRSSTRPVLVLTTVATRSQALALARALVGEGRCACASILPGIRSLYRWKGRLEDSREVLLLLKTTRAGQSRLQKRLGELHPYDVPEVLVLEPSGVGAAYARWLSENVV